jgi:hypothetical protein
VRRWCDAEKLKLLVTVWTLVARNANEATVVPVVGSGGVCGWQRPGVWSQAARFFVCAFGRNLASVAVKILSRLSNFI